MKPDRPVKYNLFNALRFWLALLAAVFLLGAPLVQAAPTTPTDDFTNNGDGTVTHKITGLTWKRCAEGQTVSGGSCAGTATTYTWDQAVALTATFSGKSDWRLPRIDELVTLVERNAVSPAINTAVFPNTPASLFWSASASAGSSAYAWNVDFGNGYDDPGYRASTFSVRLVRGGQSLGSLGLYTPSADFTDNGNGTITHQKTSLTWKRCAEGQTWTGATCSGTASATAWANAVAMTQTYAGATDWRLPTQNELLTFVEWSATNPAINTAIFPNTPASYFWSASAYAGSSDYAWSVPFYFGYGFTGSKTNPFSVRLVRGGQSLGSSVTTPPSVSLTGMGLSCPASLNAGAGGVCMAIAIYSDGSGKTVTPSSWSSSNPTALSVNSGGNLTAGAPAAATTVTITASYTENGVSKTATKNVTVSAAVAVLTGLSATCPSSLNAGAGGTCAASANYSDGGSRTVSPGWSSSNPSALSVNSGGSLTAGTPSAATAVTITASYTENGVSKTATQAVTVSAAAATLSGLTVSCPASLNAGASGTCSATAGYTNGIGNAVNATWTSSNSSVATVNGNTVTASAGLTTDTPVSINASYTENGVTKTATAMVSIKAVVVQLTNLMIVGNNSVDAGKTAPYSVNAVYSDGTTKTQSHVTWSSSGSGVTIDSNGILTAQAGLTGDVTVTITAIYTEGQTTKTAQQTVTIKATAVPVPVVPATACSGTGANLSGLTVTGNAIKKPGDALDVSYCLKNFNSASKFDIYVAVMLPDGNMFFLQTVGFFGTPLFDLYVQNQPPVKYLANTLIPDKSGTVLNIPVLPMETPTGTYTFYAIPVLAGKDVFNGFNWIGELAQYKVTLSK